MPSGTRLRPSVLSAREVLAEGRKKVRDLHDRGLAGAQVCARLTSVVDAAILQLYDAALGDLADADAQAVRQRLALAAHGGYGRRQLAPHSDIDLMLLYDGAADGPVEDLARRLTQDISDLGVQLGWSVRTPAVAVQQGRHDPQTGTSLVESRLLAGSSALYETYWGQFVSMVSRRAPSLSRQFIEARRQERLQFGETVYLLEPNVKRSRGGLRDLHLLRWLWFCKCQVADPDRLHTMGVISKFDHHRLSTATEFLLRTRNALHFAASAEHDTLYRAEQVRLAAWMGYRDSGGLLAVEKLMRDYFHHTNHIWRLAHRLSELVVPPSRVSRVLDPVFGHKVEKDYRVGLDAISATQLGQSKLRQDAEEVLRLLDLARLYDRRIAQETWYFIYRAAPELSNVPSRGTIARFLQLMSEPRQLGELLRRLHELGVLEKIIPEFSHARSLLQFNQYHKFTVDEHCIRSVEEAARLGDRRDTLGDTYRRLGTKRTLHLALLLHDLGKGHERDHSELGREIARSTGERLRLNEEEIGTLEFLVHRHLRMSHLAFRRDTSQEELICRFAEEVGSPERLTMLYLLTCADLAAVGPGVLNEWKIEVITDLYRRTLAVLVPDRAAEIKARHEEQRAAVWKALDAAHRSDPWFAETFDALPESFVSGQQPKRTAAMLDRLRNLPPRGGAAWAEYQAETHTVEFVAGVDEGSARGIFSSMAGALTANGHSIFSADIATLPGGLLLVRYVVQDRDFEGEPPPERLKRICDAMVQSIDSDKPPTFRTVWGHDKIEADRALSNLPNEVRIDTELSDECAIVEVFTIDRRGLLYQLARALHDLGFVIRFAKIGTYLDQVVDVFYVCERGGAKPRDPQRIAEIRERLTAIIEA